MRMQVIQWVAAFCLLLVLATGPGKAQLLVPRLLRQFKEKPGLSLTALGMAQDAQGRLWMASTNGIVCFDGRQFRVIHDPVLNEGDYYYHLATAPDGKIWLKRGWGFSLSYVDTRQQRIVRVSDTTRLVRNYLAKAGSHYIYVDEQANLWIGLQKHGLLKVNARTLAVEHIVDRGLDVRFITQDRRGTVYFTTGNQGFFVYNPQRRKLTNYRHNDTDTTSLSSDATFGVQARPDGSVLVGLLEGAALFQPATGQFRNLNLNAQRSTTPQTSYIREFKLDAKGDAYFSLGKTIYRYTAQGTLQQVGIRSPAHKINALHLTLTNQLWVSSGHQLAKYDLNQAPTFPSLLLLKVMVNGSELSDNTSATQNLVYNSQGHPTLTVRENDPFTMQFTLSAKLGPETLRWRLNDYDQEWIASQDIQGEAAYQLPAGTYTFTVNRGTRVKSWAPTVSTLTIVVVAPFWKRPASLVLLGLLVIGLGYYLIRTYVRRRQLAQQLAREQAEAASLRQLDELKTRFFSNITHEFRTPLTIILNATEQLTAKVAALREQPAEIATIQRHAHQLLRLITETLDIARLDGGKLEAHTQVGHPIWFIGQVVAQFAGLAQQRGLALTYNTHLVTAQASNPDAIGNETSADGTLYYFDAEKWEKIAYNLLANALKFTPSGGSVHVRGSIRANNRFTLAVCDTGIGIPAHQQTRIFDRFHQVDGRSTRAYPGTGIGLALVQELATWLGGQVGVVSQPDQGSTFTVELPLVVADQAALLSAAPPMSQPAPGPVYKPARASGLTKAVFVETMSKPLVLVIEDNADLRVQVIDYLASTYQLLWAENGRLGWEKALAEVPDLIVSDVMMPELDGYELLARLKQDDRTSHIPVILLTARSAPQSRMQGLQLGADDYLVKPFSLAELALRIGNGLRTIQLAQKRFLTQSATPLAEPVPDREAAFLNRLRQAILTHLESDTLDVDWLASQATMSRTQLNRKLTALTNLSPNRFIQRVRLERAAELLQTEALTVAQVAYQIGYQSPSHFTKVFQDHFGYPPTKLKS